MIMGIVLYILNNAIIAQPANLKQITNNSAINISMTKTSTLIFPHVIKYVDRGTGSILVQKVANAENILLVKAGVTHFKETNLSVITGDGNLYSFIVRYDSIPVTFTYYVSKSESIQPVVFNHEQINSVAIASYANGILDNDRKLHGIKDKKWGLNLSINGIYIKDKIIFYQLAIKNNSSIDYDIDLVNLYIRDKIKGKRTPAQEQEQQPLYVTGNMKTVKAGDKNVIVVALPKFTIPDAKYLAIQIMEKNGGRNLKLKIGNKKILKAIKLPDQKG